MSGLTVDKLLADLRARDVHLRVDGDTIHVDAPKGAITTEELDVLRSRKTELRSRLEMEAQLASMSFDEYGRTNLAVELTVPWMKKHLWLVPDVAYVDELVGEGIERGCIWTAAELNDLYAIDRLQEKDRRAIALLKAHFNIKIVSVEDWSDRSGDDHSTKAAPR